MDIYTYALFFLLFCSNYHETQQSRDEEQEVRLVCYYSNWAVYRPGLSKFTPENINPYLCTHLIYAFASLSEDYHLQPFDPYNDVEQGNYHNFVKLKSYNPNLKTLLAIGGWNEGSRRFSRLVSSPHNRRVFVSSALKFLRDFGFDGLDLDWEYPAFRDGGNHTTDKQGYSLLIKELRDAIDSEAPEDKLLLSVAVPATKEYIDGGFDVPEIARNADFLNLLTYDYHSAYEPMAQHHAPLHGDNELNVAWTVNYYLSLGAPRSKLVVGIPLYGRSYTLSKPRFDNEFKAEAKGPGIEGPATREKGYLAYYEICQKVKDDNWDVETPSAELVGTGPLAHSGDQWVGFDDEETVMGKAQYILDNDLGGAMIWTLDNDDFRGLCTDEPSPLVSSVRDVLFGSNLIDSPSSMNSIARSAPIEDTPVVNDAPPRRRNTLRRLVKNRQDTRETRRLNADAKDNSLDSVTTPEPTTAFECSDEGFFNNPRDCKKYFWCLDSGPANLGVVAHAFTCPSGLHFNSGSEACDYPENVVCPVGSIGSSNKRTTTRRTTTRRTTTTPSTTTTAESTTTEQEAGGENVAELLRLLQSIGGVERLQSIIGGDRDEQHTRPIVQDTQATTTLLSRGPQHVTTTSKSPTDDFEENYTTKEDVYVPFTAGIKPQVVYVSEEEEKGVEQPPYRTPIRVQVGRVVRVQNGTFNNATGASGGRRRMLVRVRNLQGDNSQDVTVGRAVGSDSRRQSSSNLLATRAEPNPHAPPQRVSNSYRTTFADLAPPPPPLTVQRRQTTTQLPERTTTATPPPPTTPETTEYEYEDEEYYDDEYEDETTTTAPTTQRPKPILRARQQTTSSVRHSTLTTVATSVSRTMTTRRPATSTTRRPATTTTHRPSTTTTRRPATTTSRSSTVAAPTGPSIELLPDNSILCQRRGVFIHPQDCSKFVLCAPASRTEQQTLKGRILNCPANQIYLVEIGRCMKGDRSNCKRL